MFTFKSRTLYASALHLAVIAAILFNALTPTVASASSPGKNSVAGRDGAASLNVEAYSYVVEGSNDGSAAQDSASTAGSAPNAQPSAPSARTSQRETSPALLLSIDPDVLVAGGSFTLSWALEGITLEAKTPISLQLRLPADFSLEGKYAGQYDPASHLLTVPVTALQGQVHLKAGSSTNGVMLQAVLFRDVEILAQASLSLSAHEQFLVDQAGSTIQAEDGRIKVQFPTGVLSEKTLVDIGQPSGDAAPPYSLSGRPFEIKAHAQQSMQELKQFSQEITIAVSYADLGIPKEQEDNLYLHWYNAETGDWEPLPTDVNEKTKTLAAVTNHFTVFDIDVNHWQASRLPTVDSFQVSSFTGAASYSLPIVVPAGPGGFQPNLALSYNSQTVDQSTTLAQASWAGMGWSLDTGSIELDSHGTNDPVDDTYFLNVGGVSTRIVKDPNGAYHAADENFWQIAGGSLWSVTDKQGTTYYFEHVARRVYASGGNCVWQPYLWSLTRVRNVFGVEINYTYEDQDKQVSCDSTIQHGDAAVYPATITYAGSKYRVRFERGSSQNRWDYQASWDTDLVFHSYQRQRLENIYVEQDLDGNGSFETILRRYEFQYANDTDADIIFPGYTWTKGGKTTTLRSVREYGVGGTTGLPAATFTYGDNLHLTRAENGYGGAVEFDYQLWYYANDTRPSQTITQNFGEYGEPCFDGTAGWWQAREGYADCDPRGPLEIWGAVGTAKAIDIWNASASPYQNHSKDLVRPGGVYKITAPIGSEPSGQNYNPKVGLYDGVHDVWGNAQGGSYFVVLPADASKAEPLIQETGAVGGGHYAYASRYTFQLLTSVYRVTEKRVSDGVHAQPYTFTYDYSDNGTDTAAVNTPANSPHSSCTGCIPYSEWYSEFRGHAQVTETGPDGRQTVTTFYQDDVLKGRPIETRVLSGSQLLTKTINQYSVTSLPVSPPFLPDCFLCDTYAGVLRTWITTDWVEQRIYDSSSYTAARQVFSYEPDYGNLITQTDQFWNENSWSAYRSTAIDYFPNTNNAYLVGLPARQQIKDASNDVIAESLNLYDANTTYNTPPTVGKLTATRVWADGAQSTGRYSQVAYAYDAWGNQTGITTYDSYGTASTAPATGGRTTTTAFDPVFHAYPISQTTPPTQNAPAGLSTTWSYDYDNNGANDYILGAPIRETDPNGNLTSARYDAFGRMTRLIRPGDSSTYPTVAIDYHDANLFWTEIRQRVDSSRYLTIRRHYDGIGRPTYTESGHTTAGSFYLANIVSYQYPAFNVVRQSMPYAAGGTAFYTTTEADVLGRPVTVTAPNGNIASYSYNGLVSTVTDAKGYSTTTTADVWGRVTSVAPPTGPGVTYQYDPLNNLTSAVRGQSSTLITYDHAGRKTAMSDPDMGNWSYTYDALGDLITQRDARQCLLSLSYDSLNRPLTKASSGAGCGTQVNTSYVYDLGSNGMGRRTSMDDASGSTFWSYDGRGRMAQETKTITGADPFVTSWTYNSADLPVTMTYPDAEVLTYLYNSNGQLDSVSSSLGTYLSNTDYDDAGRITRMDYGASIVRKEFNYFPWDTADQGGLLDSATTTRLSDQTPLQNFTYTYDRNANVGTITDNLAGPQIQTFGYDSLNRLTSANATGGVDGLYSETYGYDPSTGNLALKAGISYTYDVNHPHAVASLSNGNQYSYDSNGNMTQRIVDAQTFDLAYDAENRLTDVSLDSQQGRLPASKALFAPVSQENDAYTVSLLHANDADGVRTFTDETGKTWGTSGNVQIDTAQSKFGGSSTLLDGTESFLYTPDNEGFNFGGGDFTIDMWVRFIGLPAASKYAVLYDHANGNTYNQLYLANLSGSYKLRWVSVNGGAAVIDTGSIAWTPATGTWYHLAVVRSGNTFNLYSNGVSIKSLTNISASVGDPAASVALGAQLTSPGNTTLNGWMDEVRVSKGIARWTANFAPPAAEYPFTTVPPTSWGDDAYSFALLHTNGPDGSASFSDEVGKAWLATGNAQIDTAQSKFGDASGLFDGSGDWISAPDHEDFNVSNGDWTVDYWIKTTSSNVYTFGQAASSGANSTVSIYGMITAAGKARVGMYSGTTAYSIDSITSVNDGNWHHIAGIRYGSTLYIAVDGQLEEDVEVGAATANNSTNRFAIGALGEYTSNRYNGWMDEFRFSKGVARWTTDFDPPTAEYAPASPPPTPTPPTPTLTPPPTPVVTLTPTPDPVPFASASFVYDGDGKRVKSVINNTVTTYFVGAHYEVTAGVVTKYYYAGAQRIAMRTNGALNYLLGDHLGSTSLTVDASGNVVSEMRYKAWGEVRYASGTTPTKYTYTGQYSYTTDFGLMFYNARWYDPSLGRFISADTLCPLTTYIGNSMACTVSFSTNINLLNKYNEMNHEQNGIGKTQQAPLLSQNLDRYAYGLNNPARYSDPSGHCVDGVTTELCLILLPAGPPGWVVIGVLLILDIVLIAIIVDDINTPSSDTNLEARGGSGGAASAAKHLAMLLGASNVAGYPPHPGEPDPFGRDKNHNAKGLKADLEQLQRNVEKSGKNLRDYLADQGWTQEHINQFISQLEDYVNTRLPSEVEKGLVDPRTQQALKAIFEKLMSTGQ